METSLGMNTHMHTRACACTHTHTAPLSYKALYMCICVSVCVRSTAVQFIKRQIIGKKSGLTSFLSPSLSHSPPFGRQAKKKIISDAVNNLFACDIDSFIPVVFYRSSLRLVRRWEGVGGINATCVRVCESV